MVKLQGQWFLGYPGTDGEPVVDGATEGAFCDSCGARFMGEMVVDLDDRSHLEDPDET
ncbi:hypothetical protein ACFWRG_16470 [Micromonospora tulbaghiae]